MTATQTHTGGGTSVLISVQYQGFLTFVPFRVWYPTELVAQISTSVLYPIAGTDCTGQSGLWNGRYQKIRLRAMAKFNAGSNTSMTDIDVTEVVHASVNSSSVVTITSKEDGTKMVEGTSAGKISITFAGVSSHVHITPTELTVSDLRFHPQGLSAFPTRDPIPNPNLGPRPGPALAMP